MILIESILGHRDDPHWTQQLQGKTLHRLQLNQWDAQKNRLRTHSDLGLEIAISLPRLSFMKDGDVLYYDAASNQALVVEIALRDVLVIEIDKAADLGPELLTRTCFELGHALGNQHWPAVVKGHTVYVPLTVDEKVMGSVMRTHHFEHVRYHFMPGSEVIRYLAPHESRRLFAGADATPPGHHPAPPPETAPPGAETELHTHEDGTRHSHPQAAGGHAAPQGLHTGGH